MEMGEVNEKQDNNIIDAKERIKFKNIGEFYDLGNPEDWKELINYSKFYLADENGDRRGMIYNLLRPILSKRFKDVYPGNFAEILSKLAPLTNQETVELQAFVREREEIFDKKERDGEAEDLRRAA